MRSLKSNNAEVQNSQTNQETNQRANNRRPAVCLVIPAFDRIAGLYNSGLAYANGFLLQFKTTNGILCL
jgi:hypothetical protein